MKRSIALIVLMTGLLYSPRLKADIWGADIPLLAEIVFNTLHTMMELEQQTSLLNDQMAGIRDRINRIQTIAEVVQPSTWDKWKDPAEALRRLKLIYYTMPKEYRSEKSDEIEEELSKAMNLVARMTPQTQTSFQSGKELERRGADASPGVAEKLTASGVGTLVALQSQSQAMQSQIISLLAQQLAAANERESRSVVSTGTSFSSVSRNLGPDDGKFSTKVAPLRMQ